jgi:predicted nucleic acid-binding protein
VNLLVDSSVFIAAAQYQPYRSLISAAARRGLLVVSSVVTMELYAGFKSQEARRAFSVLHLNLLQAGKTVVPQHEDFLLGGQVLFHLSRKFGQLDFKDHFRDGLIAASAARIGTTVVTENRRNFEIWREGLARSGRRLNLYIVERK